MAFTVEDGTGLTTATSYLSEADADAYHLDRGNEAWTDADSGDREAALVLATDYLDTEFRFLGLILTDDQALAWPRSGVADQEGRDVPDDAVPVQIERATAELALASLQTSLQPNSSGRSETTAQSKSAGGLSVSTTLKIDKTLPAFHKATAWIRDLIAGDELLRA